MSRVLYRLESTGFRGVGASLAAAAPAYTYGAIGALSFAEPLGVVVVPRDPRPADQILSENVLGLWRPDAAPIGPSTAPTSSDWPGHVYGAHDTRPCSCYRCTGRTRRRR